MSVEPPTLIGINEEIIKCNILSSIYEKYGVIERYSKSIIITKYTNEDVFMFHYIGNDISFINPYKEDMLYAFSRLFYNAEDNYICAILIAYDMKYIYLYNIFKEQKEGNLYEPIYGYRFNDIDQLMLIDEIEDDIIKIKIVKAIYNNIVLHNTTIN